MYLWLRDSPSVPRFPLAPSLALITPPLLLLLTPGLNLGYTGGGELRTGPYPLGGCGPVPVQRTDRLRGLDLGAAWQPQAETRTKAPVWGRRDPQPPAWAEQGGASGRPARPQPQQPGWRPDSTGRREDSAQV